MAKTEETIDLSTFLPDLKDSLHDLNRHLAVVARRGSSDLLIDVVRIMGGVAEEMCHQWRDYHGRGTGSLQ
jgi:hypothetical protein